MLLRHVLQDLRDHSQRVTKMEDKGSKAFKETEELVQGVLVRARVTLAEYNLLESLAMSKSQPAAAKLGTLNIFIFVPYNVIVLKAWTHVT